MSMKSIKIKTLFVEQETLLGKEVIVKGWIRNHRKQKSPLERGKTLLRGCFYSFTLIFTKRMPCVPFWS